MTKQMQKTGDHSTNIQADKIYIKQGVTFEEARQIAIDVFNANFLLLSKQAAATARERAQEITEKFLVKLKEEHEQGLMQAKDPDFQYALYTTQLEFAKTGDRELGDLLINLLIDRTKQEKKNIMKIVLNESLSIVPKLTDDQLATLSIIFIFKYTTNKGIDSIETLGLYLEKYIAPFADLFSKNISCYRHLEYTGCGTLNTGVLVGDLVLILKNNYGGIFQKGFSADELQKRNILLSVRNQIFTNLFDEKKLKLDVINYQDLQNKAKELRICKEERDKLVDLYNACLLRSDEIKEHLIQKNHFMINVFNTWESLYLNVFNLTSVGITIGHANVKRILGDFPDLSIWVN